MKKRACLVLAVTVTLCGSGEIAVAREIVYAASLNGRVEEYDLDGLSLGGFNIITPVSMAVDKDGFTYVAGLFTPNVYRYRPNGKVQGLFAHPTELEGETLLVYGSAFD